MIMTGIRYIHVYCRTSVFLRTRTYVRCHVFILFLVPPPAYDDIFAKTQTPAPSALPRGRQTYYKDDRNTWEKLHEWFEMSGIYVYELIISKLLRLCLRWRLYRNKITQNNWSVLAFEKKQIFEWNTFSRQHNNIIRLKSNTWILVRTRRSTRADQALCDPIVLWTLVNMNGSKGSKHFLINLLWIWSPVPEDSIAPPPLLPPHPTVYKPPGLYLFLFY